METPVHSFEALFEQLGLDSDSAAIEKFIEDNKPIPAEVELYKAECWSRSQATFLKQAKEDDADWAEVVDQLNTQLR